MMHFWRWIGCGALWIAACSGSPAVCRSAEPPLSFTVSRSVAHSGFDGQSCWVHARAGAIPPSSDDAGGAPLVVMTMQKLLLSGSDIFFGLNQTRSDDLGQSWTAPRPLEGFQRQTFDPASNAFPTGSERRRDLLQPGDETTVCDFVPQWHTATQKLLGIGHTVWYRGGHVTRIRPRAVAYATLGRGQQEWSQWRTLRLPERPEFGNAGAGCAQRVDLPDGQVLLPIYFKEPAATQCSVTVLRCTFDGSTLRYVEHGNYLTVDNQRGLVEPSLTRFQDRYFLTLRNDEHGYVAASDDGLHFDEPVRWTFDDGEDLGNYNTQQHWVTHSDGLYLVYTRRGADNDHVFRHRAPLFIAQVDPQRLCVLRATEQVLVPERGARLGNFGVVDVTPDETWVTVSEWMQPEGVEAHGSDNSVFIARLKWSRQNKLLADTNASRPDPQAKSAWQTIAPAMQPPAEWVDQRGDYRSPLRFLDGRPVRSAEDWKDRRQEILDQWHQLMGPWPPLIEQPEVEIVALQRRGTVRQLTIRFRWTPEQWTTGYLLIPKGDSPRPAVVTVYYEPETAIGEGAPLRDFGWQLAQRGFVVLSIGTTEATAAKTYGLYYPSLEAAEVQPLSMLAYAAANAWHVLAAAPEVDAERIGIVGHSFGGKWAMFASCLFDKYACAAWSDPGIVFDDRPSVNYWEPWYLGYHSPPWRPRGVITDANPARGLYPRLVAEGRDLHELHALMAPRPFLVSGGSEDPPHRWAALNHTRAVNDLLGYDQRVGMTNRPEHSPNEESNAAIYAFFEHFLMPSR